jgi:mannose-1-phosphate guanylyltransferase
MPAGAMWVPGPLCGKSAPIPRGNVHHGDVISHETENSFVYAESGLVTTVGVKDLVVVQTKDAVLIADRNHVQDVKKSGRADQSGWPP